MSKIIKQDYIGKRLSNAKLANAVTLTEDMDSNEIQFYIKMGLGFCFEDKPEITKTSKPKKKTTKKKSTKKDD